MIKPIVHQEFLLEKPSEPATPADMQTAQDLLDTLAAHADSCVGMAANMIGVRKCIIVFADSVSNRVMFNPQITRQSGPYRTQEGCLSLAGMRPCERFRRITVRYQDMGFQWREETFTGFTAQIIQHEIDHCRGVLI